MSNIEISKLRRFLMSSFSREELQLLCADYFDEIYTNFAGSDISKGRWALELTEFCQRTRQLERLKRLLQHERSDKYAAEFATSGDNIHVIHNPLMMEFIQIQSGEFLMGSLHSQDSDWPPKAIPAAMSVFARSG